MTCTCDNPAKVWDKTICAARKAYACEECHHPIGKGEHYARVGALHDGGWDTLRFCLFCSALAQEALSAGFCYQEVGALYPDLLGWLHDGTYKQTPNGFMAADARYRDGDQELLNALHGAEVRER